MKLKNMSKDELETLSYKDLTYMLLDENKNTSMNTANIFREIITLLELPEKVYTDKIGDFYTSLTTDKRFLLLNDGTWDLRNRHTSDKIVKATDDDDDEIDEVKDDDDDKEEIDEDNYDSGDDDDDFEDSDDELKDLVVIDEDELELEQ